MIYLRYKDIREDRDLFQQEIADILKINRISYIRYEQGLRQMPINKLIILADFYNTSIDYLIGETDNKERYKKLHTIKPKIKYLRELKKLSQEDIAKVLKIHQVQYCRYETEKRLIPLDKLIILSEFYNTSIDYIVGLTDNNQKYSKSKLK